MEEMLIDRPLLEDGPDIVYPETDEDVPEVQGLIAEPTYSEILQP